MEQVINWFPKLVSKSEQVNRGSWDGVFMHYTYQRDGHTFYAKQEPGKHATWVYNPTTGEWREE